METANVRDHIFRESVKVFLAGFLMGWILGIIDFWRVSSALYTSGYLKPYLIDTRPIFFAATLKLGFFFALASLGFFFVHRAILRFFSRRKNREELVTFCIAELYVWLVFLYVLLMLRFSIGPSVLTLSKTGLFYGGLLMLALIPAVCIIRRISGRFGAGAAVFFYLFMAAAVFFPFLWLQLYTTGRIGGGEAAEPPGGNRNIVLIILDTARRDALGCYDNKKDTSPAIDRIARRGMLFRNCYAPSTWTIPTHASIFTGLYPSSHRVNMVDWRMPPGMTTLAEVLQRRGFQTAGFSANPSLSVDNYFNQGFTYYKSYSDNFVVKIAFYLMGNVVWAKLGLQDLAAPKDFPPDSFFQKAEDVVRDVRNWSRYERQENRPFFLFLNFMDVHYPYQAPEPYVSRFSSLENVKAFFTYTMEARDYFNARITLDEADILAMRELYDASMAYLDASIDMLFKFFRDEGLLDDIFVVIAGDHGEYFGEHEAYYYKMFHSFGIYKQLVAVPLILYSPGLIQPGTVVEGMVSLVDIFPTVFDVTGIEPSVMPHPLQGESLLRLAETGGRDYSYYEFQVMPMKKFLRTKDIARILKTHPGIQLKKWFSSYTVLQDQEFKLVKDSLGGMNLYHLPSDPLESKPVNDTFPDVHDRMHAALEARQNRYLEEAVKEQRGEVSNETLEQLRRLGYIQ